MARAIALTRRPTKLGGAGGTDVIEIDSCLDESHDLSNTVTDHPVEEGFNISDHVRPNPDRVTLRCFVSNTPLSSTQVQSAVREGSVDFKTTAPETIEGRGDNAFKRLKKIRDEGQMIQVVTTLKTYGLDATQGMVIESISIPRTRFNYDGLEFTVVLKQIRIVRNRSSRQTQAKDKRTRPKDKKGGAPTKPAKERDGTLTQVTGYGEVPISSESEDQMISSGISGNGL